MPSPSGSTAKYGFPYLLESDVPDVATASQLLAQGVENEIIVVTQQPGTILASKRIASANYNATVASYTCIDSTNAKLTFVAPPSGNVLMQESSLWNVGTAAEVLLLQWSIGTTNNTNMVGSGIKSGALINAQFLIFEHVITGLTAGTSYTLALQWAYGIAAGGMNAGNGTNDLVLKAIAL